MPLRIDLFTPANLPSDVERQLVALVARVFPDEPALRGTWFFQTVPDFVVVGFAGDAVVGLRPVARRTVTIGGRDVKIAGGVIPTVDPDHRGRGHARALTEATLAEVTRRGDELSLAFLFDSAPADFLRPFGFRRLDNRFSYVDPGSGAVVEESMRAFARALDDRVSLDDVAAAGDIHLGTGTW